MGSDDAEIIRAAYEAWNRGDLERFFEALAPDVEWWPSEQSPEPGPFRGHEALESFMRSYYESFDEIRFELREALEARDPGQVLVIVGLYTRGKGSGVEVEIRVAHLLTVRDGKIARGRVFTNLDEAREAAGFT